MEIMTFYNFIISQLFRQGGEKLNYVKDETYWIISNEAYELNIDPKTYRNNNIPGWRVADLDEKLLHDTNGSGFDATVFHNENTNQVIIGYRGTEPGGRPIWSRAMDIGTDISDVVGGRAKNLNQVHDYYVNNQEEIKNSPHRYKVHFISMRPSIRIINLQKLKHCTTK